LGEVIFLFGWDHLPFWEGRLPFWGVIFVFGLVWLRIMPTIHSIQVCNDIVDFLVRVLVIVVVIVTHDIKVKPLSLVGFDGYYIDYLSRRTVYILEYINLSWSPWFFIFGDTSNRSSPSILYIFHLSIGNSLRFGISFEKNNIRGT